MRGEELYKLFNKHIKQLGNNGLSIIDAATGYGKTFQARRFIAENMNERKFIFLVPQKKLFLNINEKNEFLEIVKKNLSYEPIICEITPTIDTFKKYFLSISSDDIFAKIENKDKIRKIIIAMNESKNNEYTQLFIENFNKEEIQFRHRLIKILKSKSAFKKNKECEGLEAYNKQAIISFFNDYDWIEKLYPSVLLPYANFIQMTIQKAYFPIDTLWFGHHEISNNYDQVFKDFIVFIDEFDATKEALQEIIISNITSKERVNLFKTIKYIYNSISNICSKKVLPKDFYGQRKEEICNEINEFYKKLKEGYEKYNLKGTLKFIHNEKKDRFLFRDKKVIDVTKNKELVLKYNEEDNVNYVELFTSNSNDVSLEKVCDFIFDELKEFTILIARISKNYFEYIKNLHKGEDYSLLEIISSIVTELNIGQMAEEYFINQVYQYLTFTMKLKKNIDGDFLDFGFQYFCMENDFAHDLSTDVYYYHFNELPEHFVLGIACKNIVIGLSATATLKTYVKNYDVNFLCKKLGNSFIQINKEEIDLLSKDFEQNEKTNINIEYFNNQKQINTISIFKEMLSKIDLYYERIQWSEIFKNDSIYGKKSYRLQTYYNLLEVFKKYCEFKIHGMICFLNFKIDDTEEIEFNKLSEALVAFSEEKGHKCRVFALDSKKFDDEYNNVKSYLKQENVFIISTYKTLALGKNLQYKTLDDEEKDLDGIYLDDVSYILPSVEEKNEKSLAEYLYAIEYLKSELIVNKYSNFQKYITEGFKKYLTGKGTLSIEHDAIKAKDAIVSKYAIQSIGRICRTKNKSKQIYIYMHQDIKESLSRKKEELLSRMLNYEFRSILNKLDIIEEEEMPEYTIENNYNNSKSHFKITYLSYNWWTNLKRKEWIELREQVLKFPTKLTNNHYRIYYCQFKNPINKYRYQTIRLSDNKLKFYNITETDISTNYSNIVSCESSRLKEMLKSKYVYDYFVKHNYAIDFEKGIYIINPVTFQRIYKGAVGEVAARAILEGKGLTLKEIKDNKHFEKFDYYYGSIFYDMKNWNENFTQQKDELLKKITKKAIKCGAKRVFIINVLKNNYKDNHGTTFDEKIIYEIPWLYDSENDCYNEEAIKMMKEAELLYEDFN